MKDIKNSIENTVQAKIRDSNWNSVWGLIDATILHLAVMFIYDIISYLNKISIYFQILFIMEQGQ